MGVLSLGVKVGSRIWVGHWRSVGQSRLAIDAPRSIPILRDSLASGSPRQRPLH